MKLSEEDINRIAEKLKEYIDPYPPLTKVLNVVLQFAEAFSICLIIVFGLVFLLCLIFKQTCPTQTHVGQVLQFLNENWKILILLLIPMFFRAIRILIMRINKLPFWEQKDKKSSLETKPEKLQKED